MEPRLATRPTRPIRPNRPTRLARSARLAGRAVALGVVAAVAVPVAALSVGAQTAPALTVEAVHPLGDGEFHFIVALADGNGDPLSGTTVTATPTSPGGTTGEAVALPSSGDGTYQGPVPLPEDGTWTVRIASADPAGAIDYGFAVRGDTGTPAGPVATTVPATTTAPPATTAPTTTAPPATTVPEVEPEAAASRAADEDEDEDDGGSGFPVVLLIIGAALVVAVAGVPLALRTIRGSTASTGSTADDPSGAGETPEGR